ncbi:MAG: helix-turn-helix transcriptional regulator [Desulfovibrio sp.]|jgi:DNA-binding CsgD family transcriptional regulator/PAS domain-containing protein|nr:helix-turn-helix transcriptional regulator [Desulfovibrio sp.]
MPVRYTYGKSGELLDCLLELCGHMNVNELFDAYLRRITGLIFLDTCGFYIYDKDGEEVVDVGSIGVEKRFLDLYEKKGRKIDPLLAKVKAERTICCSDQLMSLGEWHSHPVFKVFDLERMSYIMDAPICLSGLLVGTLHFSRTIENGPFGAAEVRMVEVLRRFVELGMSNALKYSDIKRDGEIFRQALHCSPEAVVIADSGGEVRFMNRSAGEMFSGLGEGAGEEAVQSLIRTGRDLLLPTDGAGALADDEKPVRADGGFGAPEARQNPERIVNGFHASAAERKSWRTADGFGLSDTAWRAADNPGVLQAGRESGEGDGTLLTVENGGLRAGLCALPGTAGLLLAVLRKGERCLLPVWERILSSREKDILHLAAKGLRNREIAAAAFVSVNTVKRHLDNMYVKLNVSGRTSLVAKAFGLNEYPHPA